MLVAGYVKNNFFHKKRKYIGDKNMEKAEKAEKKITKKKKNTNILESHFNTIVIIILITVLLILVYSLFENYQTNQAIVGLSASNQDLREENELLREKIAEQNMKLDVVNKQFEEYNLDRVSKNQFTEIYMQLQELTGMVSEENKREFYIGRIVNIVSGSNNQLESETIYSIAKSIYEESTKYNFNPLLVSALIKVESNFIIDSVSDSYAFGLCQVRRFIAKELAENLGIKWDGAENTLFDPEKNIKIGLYYLSLLYDDFGDIELALTAYNHGPFRIQELMSQESEIPNGYADKVLQYYTQYRGFDIDQAGDVQNRETE